MEIKEILRALREKKGMTQEQLADKVYGRQVHV